MKQGFIAVETHRERPGIVRLLASDAFAEPDHADARQPQIRYIARFNDVEAGLMHCHEAIKRRLIDLDNHLYRVTLERAIAAIESVELRHWRTYIDPFLDTSEESEIHRQVERIKNIRCLWDRFFTVMGYLGIGLLLFNALFLTV